MADDTGTDSGRTGGERYLADRLRDPEYRKAHEAFLARLKGDRPDAPTGTDWAALADRLDTQLIKYDTLAGGPPRKGFIVLGDVRAAAVGLRRLAQLDTAIGDPEELRGWVDEYNGIMLRNFAAHILAAVLGSGEQPERTEP